MGTQLSSARVTPSDTRMPIVMSLVVRLPVFTSDKTGGASRFNAMNKAVIVRIGLLSFILIRLANFGATMYLLRSFIAFFGLNKPVPVEKICQSFFI